jgi:hypothetical protein
MAKAPAEGAGVRRLPSTERRGTIGPCGLGPYTFRERCDNARGLRARGLIALPGGLCAERRPIVATEHWNRGLEPSVEIEYRASYLLENVGATREEIVEELEGIQRASERLRREERRAHEVMDRLEAVLRTTREQFERFNQGQRPAVRHLELVKGGDDA